MKTRPGTDRRTRIKVGVGLAGVVVGSISLLLGLGGAFRCSTYETAESASAHNTRNERAHEKLEESDKALRREMQTNVGDINHKLDTIIKPLIESATKRRRR